mgnify:FL=1|jgi:hypothetical protein
MKTDEDTLEKIKKIVKEVSDNHHEQFNLSSEAAQEILAKKILEFCKKDLNM